MPKPEFVSWARIHLLLPPLGLYYTDFPENSYGYPLEPCRATHTNPSGFDFLDTHANHAHGCPSAMAARTRAHNKIVQVFRFFAESIGLVTTTEPSSSGLLLGQ